MFREGDHAGLSSRVPDQPVALALYLSECQFRTVTAHRLLVKPSAAGVAPAIAGHTVLRCGNVDAPARPPGMRAQEVPVSTPTSDGHPVPPRPDGGGPGPA